MPLVVRAFPVLPNREAGLKSFAASLAGERGAEATAFYRGLGVRHESWHVQRTEHGTWVIGVTDVDDPGRRAPQYAAAQADFHRWFKDQVLDLTGIDPDTQPLGPPTEVIFSWSAPQ
ncbi:MAG: hypothetical protein ACRD16_15715 [Thermoanaerobaculia bacterium]